jgi:hypothetical protein
VKSFLASWLVFVALHVLLIGIAIAMAGLE